MEIFGVTGSKLSFYHCCTLKVIEKEGTKCGYLTQGVETEFRRICWEGRQWDCECGKWLGKRQPFPESIRNLLLWPFQEHCGEPCWVLFTWQTHSVCQIELNRVFQSCVVVISPHSHGSLAWNLISSLLSNIS